MPVQRVSRPDHTFRGFSGEVAAGSITAGDEVTVLPRGERARVKSILVAGSESDFATSGQPVTLTLDREVDVSRGDVLEKDASPFVSDMLRADLLWMDEAPLTAGRIYWLQVGTRRLGASVMAIRHKVDINTGAHLPASRLLKNEIASVEISLTERAVFTPFLRLRALGGFILIDRVTHQSAACGMIRRAENLTWQKTDVTRATRAASLGQRPMTIWFTGLSGSGKSTIANALEKRLAAMGRHTMLLDGDNIRMGLCRDLGFREEDRVENIRRVAEAARLLNEAGLIVLVSCISPYRADREEARKIIGEADFTEVYVATPLSVCEARDVKGLYKKARAGKIPNFTGVTSPYEPPASPDAVIDTGITAPDEAAEHLLTLIEGDGR